MAETLMCPLTDHKGQSIYSLFDMKHPGNGLREREKKREGELGEYNHSQRETHKEKEREELGANGLWDTDIISYQKWHPCLSSPLYK